MATAHMPARGRLHSRNNNNNADETFRMKCHRQLLLPRVQLYRAAAETLPLGHMRQVRRARDTITLKVAKPGAAAADDGTSSSSAPADTSGAPLSDKSSTVDSTPSASPAASFGAVPHEAASAPTASISANQGTLIAASLSGGGGGVQGGPPGAGGAPAQSTVALMTRFNGIGYTFVLAGFLKIVTVGGLVISAPVDAARTAFGKASPYLMVPVSLGMCWVAKQVVDTGLNESKRFMQYMVATLVLLYFALVKLMYKYAPESEWVRRPRPRLPGPLADLRAELGDKDLLAGSSISDSRSYLPERPGKELYDDVAWYEGRYPSQMTAGSPAEGRARRGQAAAAARLGTRRAVAAASETDDDYCSALGLPELTRAREAGLAQGTDSSSTTAAAATNRRSFLADNTR